MPVKATGPIKSVSYASTQAKTGAIEAADLPGIRAIEQGHGAIRGHS